MAGPFGENKIVWHDDFVATEISQVGTQFDGLGHIGVQIGVDGDRSQMRFYNGFVEVGLCDRHRPEESRASRSCIRSWRAASCSTSPARAASKRWTQGECASMDDVKATLEKQGMADFEFKEGDAILFRYGWERHWDDPAKFNDGQPGICMDVARWVAEEVKAGVTGGDTWAATDPVPYPDEPGCAFCMHEYLQTRHGIVNQENMTLKQLADDGVYVFTYVYSPVPIAGATRLDGGAGRDRLSDDARLQTGPRPAGRGPSVCADARGELGRDRTVGQQPAGQHLARHLDLPVGNQRPPVRIDRLDPQHVVLAPGTLAEHRRAGVPAQQRRQDLAAADGIGANQDRDRPAPHCT